MTENHHRLATEDGGAACDQKGKTGDGGCNTWVHTCFLWKPDLTSNPKCVTTPLDQAATLFAKKFCSMPSWHRILDWGGGACAAAGCRPGPVLVGGRLATGRPLRDPSNSERSRPHSALASGCNATMSVDCPAGLCLSAVKRRTFRDTSVIGTRGQHYLSFCLVSKIVGF